MVQQSVCSLSDVPAGTSVRVNALTAEGPARSRLYSLGFTPGTIVEVCPGCSGTSARRVRVRDSFLILDLDMAAHIECTHGEIYV